LKSVIVRIAEPLPRINTVVFPQAFASGGKFNSAYKFEEILQLAHEIISEVKANPPEPGNTYDPAFVCSFCLGDAYSYDVYIFS
jgi:hypothetical protein